MDGRVKCIADRYGKDNQRMQTIQELGELVVELSRIGTKREDAFALAEEIADVEIMLEQMKYMFGLDETCMLRREFKIKRQLERISGEDKT